jgi:hypothetical protein
MLAYKKENNEMSDSPASPFIVWRDWMNQLLATVRQQVESGASRHEKMVGSSATSTLMWARTGPSGVESGCFLTMDHGGCTHVSGVQGLVSFIGQLPTDVREQIKESLS